MTSVTAATNTRPLDTGNTISGGTSFAQATDWRGQENSGLRFNAEQVALEQGGTNFA